MKQRVSGSEWMSQTSRGRRLLSAVTSLVLLMLSYACVDEPQTIASPEEPEPQGTVVQASDGIFVSASQMRAVLDRQARGLATALGASQQLRAAIRQSIDESVAPEGKLDFKATLRADGSRVLRAVAEGLGTSESAMAAALDSTVALEVYLPVDDHRERWGGGSDMLVVPFFSDDDPTAEVYGYDGSGRVVPLSLEGPPRQPVLVITPAEHDFGDRDPSPLIPGLESVVAASGGMGTMSISGTDGVYMVYSHLDDLHEPWTNGDPEIAVHVGVHEQPADSVVWKSCAGDDQSGAYYFDQNSTNWNDTVLIASRSTVSEEEFEIFVWEDDWNRCDGTNNLTPHQSSGFLSDLFASAVKYGEEVKEDFVVLGDSTSGVIDYLEAVVGIVTNGYKIAGSITHDDLVGVAGKLGTAGCFTIGSGQFELPLKDEDGNSTDSYIRIEENFGTRVLCDVDVDIGGDSYACDFGSPTGHLVSDVFAPGTGVTYQWKEDGVVRGTSSSYTLHDKSPGWRSIQLTVTRTDDNDVATDFKSIQVIASGTGPCPE